eukprot:SAG25_NODE_2922_length_1312_cov_5.028854_2_plen_24_part_01
MCHALLYLPVISIPVISAAACNSF